MYILFRMAAFETCFDFFKVGFSFHLYVNFNSTYLLFKQCAFTMYLKSIQTLLIIYVTIKDFSVLCAYKLCSYHI